MGLAIGLAIDAVRHRRRRARGGQGRGSVGGGRRTGVWGGHELEGKAAITGSGAARFALALLRCQRSGLAGNRLTFGTAELSLPAGGGIAPWIGTFRPSGRRSGRSMSAIPASIARIAGG